jgi:PadR family transcriptional regulator AphA
MYRCDILCRYMEQLSPTARVLLAMIRNGRRTGYEIKQLVDVSTRFFWAASYGQIYPELKRLEQAGLIAGEDDPTGGRQRRAYSLTPAGEAALDAWLRGSANPLYEVRDESLLKLFFSNELTDEERLGVIRRMRDVHQGVVDGLKTVEEAAAAAGGGPNQVLQFGLGLHGWVVEWCEKQESEIEQGGKS